MRIKIVIFFAIVTAVALGWLVTSAATPQASVVPSVAPVQEVPVLTVMSSIRDLPVSIETMGTLHPSAFVDVRPQVSGTLAEALVSEGDWVEAGTPLFRIDPLVYRIKVQEVQAQIALDQLALDAANKKLERFRSLAEKDLIAQSEWDEWENQTATAQAILVADDVRRQMAQLDLDSCTINAPMAGRIGRIPIHVGSLITSGQTVLTTISQMDPLFVEFELTAREFSQILVEEAPIQLQPIARESSKEHGTICYFDNHFHPKSGLLSVRGTVPNASLSLRPGESVRVEIPVDVISQAQLIPQKAVRYGEEGPYVLVVLEDQTIAERLVTLGMSHGHEVVILTGLNPNERVVTEGHLRVTPGTKVNIGNP